MKKFISVILGGMCAFNFCLAADDWAQFWKYENSNKEITEGENLSPVVVFMGNSITEGWVLEDPDFFTENNFAGRGISGQTTYQMLLRFRDDILNLNPQIVVINGGTNDIAENNHNYNEDRTLGNIISMVELAQIYGIKPVLTSLLPSAGFYWRESIEDVPLKISSLNQRIRNYADEKGLVFIDYYPLLVADGGALNPAYSGDGVHPNQEGYKVMESIALPILKDKLEK